MARHQKFWLAFLAAHLLVTAGVALRETVWLVGRGATIFPTSIAQFCRPPEGPTEEDEGRSNLNLTQLANTYLHLAGIESGYGFFAPNVPDSYHLSFVLTYPDKPAESLTPETDRGESNLRLASLTDYIGRTRSDLVREDMIKLLAFAAWREDQDAITIRALLSALAQPGMEEFQQGKRQVYEPVYAYEFTSPRSSAPPSHN